uniref:RING-type E3 ubiquitin transferase n=1 Tax=Serinus canaria TaxID=9135 RepID=A0A8C9UG19_SERCA
MIMKEISYVFPCLHQFCYGCILQWAEKTPKCPLCKRRILSILHSMETENDYIHAILIVNICCLLLSLDQYSFAYTNIYVCLFTFLTMRLL